MINWFANPVAAVSERPDAAYNVVDCLAFPGQQTSSSSPVPLRATEFGSNFSSKVRGTF
jgi:hypothetical protein